VASYANPQSLNRFAYVLNNPLRYTDPTGHKETECSHQSDPLCSATNGTSTGNTNGGGGNGNGKNKEKHGNDSGGDILGNGSSDGTSAEVPLSEACSLSICTWYYQNISAYQYTPIAASASQFITGNYMLMLEPAMAVPDFAPVAVPLYILSFAENRGASLVQLQALDYQSNHDLYGVTKKDVGVALVSLFLGSIPPLTPYVSDISFASDIFNTDWKNFP
jgi:hypothetical protein